MTRGDAGAAWVVFNNIYGGFDNRLAVFFCQPIMLLFWYIYDINMTTERIATDEQAASGSENNQARWRGEKNKAEGDA